MPFLIYHTVYNTTVCIIQFIYINLGAFIRFMSIRVSPDSEVSQVLIRILFLGQRCHPFLLDKHRCRLPRRERQ